MTALSIHVTGTPAPQGSKRGFVVKGRVVMTESSTKVKPWRQDVKAAALNAVAELAPWEPMTGPLVIHISFSLPRPRYHYGTGKNANLLKPSAPAWVDKKPDIDKLTRSTLDALGEAGVWRDDSQVAVVMASKRYATTGPPGAAIAVNTLPQDAVAAVEQPPTAPAATVLSTEQGVLL